MGETARFDIAIKTPYIYIAKTTQHPLNAPQDPVPLTGPDFLRSPLYDT